MFEGRLERLRDLARPALVPVLAIVTSFLVGAVLIVLTDVDHLRSIGDDPIGSLGGAVGALLRGYGAMLSGAVGDPGRVLVALRTGDERDVAAAIWAITEMLVSATPFIFVGLGLAVSFRAGLLNLGADGQFTIGMLGATIAAFLIQGQLPPLVTLVVGLVAGTLTGAAYGFIPGFLKARTNAHEVITTLMLNYIAPSIAIFAFQLPAFLEGLGLGPFRLTPSMLPSVPLVVDLPTIRLDWSFFVALLAAAATSFLLFRTTRGFELRAAGHNRTAALGAGMQPGRSIIRAMALSGGLAGLGGAFIALGPVGGGGPAYGIGFVALAMALIAGLRPSGVVLIALLYGALNNGAKSMAIESGVPLSLLVVIIAFAMMFVAAPDLIRRIWRIQDPNRGLENAASMVR